jgi:hypothetical protein
MAGFRRSEFLTTTKVEKSIAAAAITGLIRPVMASMMPTPTVLNRAATKRF